MIGIKFECAPERRRAAIVDMGLLLFSYGGMLALLAGETVAPETEIEVTLIVRESTGPAPRLKSAARRAARRPPRATGRR